MTSRAHLHTCPFDGRTMTAAQWAKEFGIDSKSFRQRVQRWGLDDERTWKEGAEQGNEEYRKLSDKITSEKIARLQRIPQPSAWEMGG